MQAATLSDIKKELSVLDASQLKELCLRLGRFKKDNKELLTYLLFEAQNENQYIQSIKNGIDEEFSAINTTQLYYAKKGLRKVLRNITKYIRYSGSKQTEVEVLIHFCRALKESGISIQKSVQITNLYKRQKIKIEKAMSTLHEDLQADYYYEFEQI